MQHRGVWEPLPLIVYGYAIHPLVPGALTQRDYRKSRQNADTRTSSDTEREREDHVTSKDVVPLEVGDNIYAFEQYVPKGKEVQGIWYRGYVSKVSRHCFPHSSCLLPSFTCHTLHVAISVMSSVLAESAQCNLTPPIP